MTRLDEIEKETEQRGMQSEWLKDSAFTKADSSILRMARVIRELAIRAKAYEWIMSHMPSPVTCAISDSLEGFAGIIIEDNLSPDATEVINDLAG